MTQSDTFEARVQLGSRRIHRQWYLRVQTQIRKLQCGEGYPAEFGNVRCAANPADRLKCPGSMAQFLAEHQGPGLLVKGGVKLASPLTLGGFGQTERLLGLLAQPGLPRPAL